MSDSTYYYLVKAMVSGEGKDFRQQELQVLSGNDYYNICGVWIQHEYLATYFCLVPSIRRIAQVKIRII